MTAGVLYAVFKRTDGGCWQGIAGGGEKGETPLQAAQREALEEAREFAFTSLPTQRERNQYHVSMILPIDKTGDLVYSIL
jgi:ADP-ribose pyrophosphatase YjhB (NUDIX family)